MEERKLIKFKLQGSTFDEEDIIEEVKLIDVGLGKVEPSAIFL